MSAKTWPPCRVLEEVAQAGAWVYYGVFVLCALTVLLGLAVLATPGAP